MNENKTTQTQDFVSGLREIADWYEAHPEIPPPLNSEISNYSLNEKSEALMVLEALKPCKKNYSEDLFEISREFHGVNARFLFYRDQVCIKKVVATKEVPEEVIPARPETIIPAHTEEIVEWECGPLLGART